MLSDPSRVLGFFELFAYNLLVSCFGSLDAFGLVARALSVRSTSCNRVVVGWTLHVYFACWPSQCDAI